jgi:GntR family transcriptional regulator/MocR family aminotransferase
VTLEVSEGGEAMFLRIARSLVRDIERGRLGPGERLPSSRALAQSLSVHRNTVVSAYAELAAEGWIRTSEASGTFVASDLPRARPRPITPRVSPREQVPLRAGFELPPLRPTGEVAAKLHGEFHLTGGVPDVRLAPHEALARAYRRVLRRQPRAVLAYGAPEGDPMLRAALARMLAATRGIATRPDDVLVTRGSQMALSLLARLLLGKGEVIAVEALGYPPAWRAFEETGATLVPIPVDRDGLDVDALAALCARTRVRAVYVTPHHQYPTTVTLSPARRLRLLELAAKERLAIIEDDYDHEFHYAGRPVLPLASADRAGVVLYVGTLAKILAPGLRLGYLVAPRPVLERVAALRFTLDRQGDAGVERAVAELIDDGELQRHAWRARRIYQARRDFFVERLRAAAGDALGFDAPNGGLSIWARVDRSLDPIAWAERARKLGVLCFPGRRFSFEGQPKPYLRLGFGAHSEPELATAIDRLIEATPRPKAARKRSPA